MTKSLVALLLVAVSAQAQTVVEKTERPSTKAYPKKVQQVALATFKSAVADSMKSQVEDFNKLAKEENLETLLERSGLSEKEAALVLGERGDDDSKPSIEAEWKDGAITVTTKGGNVLAVGPEELIDSSIRVNGSEFKWNKKRKFEANFKAYTAFLGKVLNVSQRWNPMDLLIAPAYAGFNTRETFELQIAGVSLFYYVTQNEGKVLHAFNQKIDSLATRCEKGEAAKKILDENLVEYANNLAASINAATSRIGDPSSAPFLRSCASIDKYGQTLTALKVDKDNQPIPGTGYVPPLPQGMCTNLDRLSKCLTPKMEKENLAQKESDGVYKKVYNPKTKQYEDVEVSPPVRRKKDWQTTE